MRAKTTVSYRSEDGVSFRYSVGETGLIEQTQQSDGKWKSHGSVSTLWWDVKKSTLKQSGDRKYVLQKGSETDYFQEQLLLLCKQCSSRVVFEYQDGECGDRVIVGAPSGDYILFKVANGFVEEQLLTNEGWSTVGKATHLTYSPNCRGLIDQNGCGGVLPLVSLNQLLLSLRTVCEQSGVRHTNLTPAYTPQYQTIRKSLGPRRISRPQRKSQMPPPFLNATRSASTGSGNSSDTFSDKLYRKNSTNSSSVSVSSGGSFIRHKRRSKDQYFLDHELSI